METLTPVRCATCQKFSVQRANKDMQDQGFGCCDRREPFICFGARKERGCEHHVLAASDVIAKREAWLAENLRDEILKRPNAPHEGPGGFSPGPLDAVVGPQREG